MLRHLALFLCLVLFASLVAACGDDDDDTDNATPTAANVAPTATTSDEPEATATEPEATATTATSPTASAGAATETTDKATPTEAAVEPTESSGSPTATALTPDEQAIMAVLLSPNDLPGEWNELRREVPADDEEDNPGFCGSGEFPRADEKIAQVEVEMQAGDNARFILQNLTEFEEETAVEAMAFARDSFSCSEFTDEDGTTIRVEPADAEDLGDESFAMKVTFPVSDAGELAGDIYFVRIGGLISIATVLEVGSYDPDMTAQVAEIATDKMSDAAGKTVGLEDEQEALITALITQSDLPQGWNVLSAASPTDPEGWTGLCDAPVNPDASAAVSRVSVDFYEGLSDKDATVQQVITAYPTGGGDSAMDYERDSVDCTDWTTGQTTISLTSANYASDADDTFAVEFAYEDEQAGKVSGNWIVVQVGDFVANIIYTDPEGVDPDLAQDIIDAAVDRMQTVSSAGL
jgi:hypothetical protein